jgi:hypothetical protein
LRASEQIAVLLAEKSLGCKSNSKPSPAVFPENLSQLSFMSGIRSLLARDVGRRESLLQIGAKSRKLFRLGLLTWTWASFSTNFSTDLLKRIVCAWPKKVEYACKWSSKPQADSSGMRAGKIHRNNSNSYDKVPETKAAVNSLPAGLH